VAEQDSEIFSLKAQLNSLEQYNRSWSVRIMGLPLSSDEEKSPDLIKKKIYSTVLKPILEGAVQAGDLAEVPPSADCVLERAHVLRAKEGTVKSLIAWFYARDTRALIFKHKKTSAPKHPSGPLKDRYKYQIFEALTSVAFKKMRSMAADNRIAACCSAGGQLRYRLHDDPAIKKVANVFDSVDKIIG
jgi:hypothetical protein